MQSSSGKSVCQRKTTMIASYSVVNAVKRGIFGSIAASRTKARLRHFGSLLEFSPCCAARSLVEAFDRCSTALTACMVVAQS